LLQNLKIAKLHMLDLQHNAGPESGEVTEDDPKAAAKLIMFPK